MQLINVINSPWFFGSLAGLFALYVVGLSVVLAIWTWRDIRERSNSGLARFLSPLVVLVFGFAGFVPYLVLRPRLTFAERADERRDLMLLAEAAKKFECPTCFAPVEGDFAYCPSCKAEFRPVCACGATLDQTWKRCAFCGSDIAAEVRARKYAKPLPAVDLPPAVEPITKSAKPAKVKMPKASKAAKKLAASVPVAPIVASAKLPEAKMSVPIVAKSTGSAKATKISFGGLTGRFRKALAIKR